MPGLGRVPSPPDPKDHPLGLHLPNVASIMAQLRDEHQLLTFDPDELYDRCKDVDGYPGDGTFPRVAMEILRSRGALVASSPDDADVGGFRKIQAYARLRSLEEVKVAIFTYGSCGIGSPWYNSWFVPGPHGLIPAPDVDAGGHWWVAVGWSDKRKALRAQNSWGPQWGEVGRFWMPYEFLGDFSAQGDDATWEAWRTIDLPGDFDK